MDDDMSMTSLENKSTPPLFEPSVKKQDDHSYDAQREALIEKNDDNNKEATMDFSTPLSDVMDSQEVQPLQQMMAPPAPQSGIMMAPPQQQVVAPPQQKAAAPACNPMGLSDEQMDALIVGGIAAIVFSKQAQEKLRQMVPQAFSESGARTATGLIASGLIASVLYYFGKNFISKRN